MTYRSEWVYLRRNLLSIEVRIAETNLKIKSEKFESLLYESKGTPQGKKASLKHKAYQRSYERYREQLLDTRAEYLTEIKKTIFNYMSNEQANMWWDMFMKNMKISELAKKYNLSVRQINNIKQGFIREIGNDGSISEIVPYSKKEQPKANDNRRPRRK